MKTQTTTTNLIGYIRVSTEGQQDGVSLSEQARKISAWAEKEGHNLTAIFSDADSGENMQGRKGFLAAIKHCNLGNADGLVVANFDRYSRSTFDSELVARVFKAKGKQLYSVEQNFDLKDKYGRFTFRVNQAVAELVREQIVDRLHSCRVAKADQGGWLGCRPPYGYNVIRGELVEDETEQLVIRYMFRLYHWAGLTPWQIMQRLNKKIDNGDERFLPKQAKPGARQRRRPYTKGFTYLWSQKTIKNILMIKGKYHQERVKPWQANLKPHSLRGSRAS